MKTWLFLILTVIIQEPASTDAAIFQVRHLGYNLWIVHLIWLVATLFDIWFGYVLGKYIQRKFKETKFEKFAEKWAGKFEQFIGKRGEKSTLVLLGTINFPYLNSFLASWFSIPFKNVFACVLIGDAIYWAIEWGINIGVRSFVIDPHLALYSVIALGLLFSIFSKRILNKMLKKSTQE